MTPQTYLEISTRAFNHNVCYYKNAIGSHHKLAAVIKGNGYGHGLHQMADLCNQNTLIDWICVAQLSEALTIQTNKPILVMGYCDVSVEHAIKKNIHFMVDNFEYAHNFHMTGKKYSYQFNIHVKVDTGLSRMGISADQTLPLIKKLQKLDYIKITGIYSHFSASNNDPVTTQQQYNLFNNILDQLAHNNITVENIHMSNSAAISTVQYTPRFNLFRVGIGLYGLGHDKSYLQPIMTWKTRITNIKTIAAGSHVGYCSEYLATRATRIALLPIGYYDGYTLRFSNKAYVMINGCYAPVIGRISMNVTMVDVTDCIAHINDEVIIINTYPHINIHDLAEIAGIKNIREILTGINPAIFRIVLK